MITSLPAFFIIHATASVIFILDPRFCDHYHVIGKVYLTLVHLMFVFHLFQIFTGRPLTLVFAALFFTLDM